MSKRLHFQSFLAVSVICITGGLTLKQEHYEARGKSLSEFFQCPQYIEIDKAAGLIHLAKIKAIKIRLHRDINLGIDLG